MTRAQETAIETEIETEKGIVTVTVTVIIDLNAVEVVNKSITALLIVTDQEKERELLAVQE